MNPIVRAALVVVLVAVAFPVVSLFLDRYLEIQRTRAMLVHDIFSVLWGAYLAMTILNLRDAFLAQKQRDLAASREG